METEPAVEMLGGRRRALLKICNAILGHRAIQLGDVPDLWPDLPLGLCTEKPKPSARDE